MLVALLEFLPVEYLENCLVAYSASRSVETMDNCMAVMSDICLGKHLVVRMVQLTVCKMVEELDDEMADEWDHKKVES